MKATRRSAEISSDFSSVALEGMVGLCLVFSFWKKGESEKRLFKRMNALYVCLFFLVQLEERSESKERVLGAKSPRNYSLRR